MPRPDPDKYGTGEIGTRNDIFGMVKEIKKDRKTLFVCEACGFAYEEKVWAEKCQQWCEQHHGCNLEIAAHAVPME